MVFEQKDIDVPTTWSMTATNVVVSRRSEGLGSEERETSIKQLIGRVADRSRPGVLRTATSTPRSLPRPSAPFGPGSVHQHMAFNSPVWFNVGVKRAPSAPRASSTPSRTPWRASWVSRRPRACCSRGSGTGNLTHSPSKEQLKGGGTASGPVSFMRGFDAFMSVIKSGGKTRRAAKMVILDIDHPDIMEFIDCKVAEERKAWSLIDAGYDGGFNVPGGAYDSVFFQNSNNSVRVNDAFMKAVEANGKWETRSVTDGEVVETLDATTVMNHIAEAAWLCGDPGLQFDTTVNDWHPCINTDRIYASNPCSEYMFLDNSACNLASLNLMKFRTEDGGFDTDRFLQAVRTTITAQEILVDRASYPTPAIEQNSLDYRPLGLGFANLGALLMAKGLPYDSDEGRNYAGAITALMHGEAYAQSSRIAELRGAFAGYHRNQKPMLRVIGKHRKAAKGIPKAGVSNEMRTGVKKVWDECCALGQRSRYNGQVTVLAPPAPSAS